MRRQDLAVFYQSEAPPVIDGIKKPVKPGGYTDSGADIACALKEAGSRVVTPHSSPRSASAVDWVFPDSEDGFAEAYAKGARTFWLNTVLYDGHPVESQFAKDVRFVGQVPRLVQKFDDKFKTNELLRTEGLPVASSRVIEAAPSDVTFPCVLKPIRGRGSEGVCVVESEIELRTKISDWLRSEKYGRAFMLEELLPGDEITIAVMPPGEYVFGQRAEPRERHWALPPVRRSNHEKMIAPYSGSVAVVNNSAVLAEAELEEPTVLAITKACELAAALVGARAPIRIDCRQNAAGEYKIFDLNMKPNMTGTGRPGREDQTSLVAIAARSMGWSFTDLCKNMLQNAWLPMAGDLTSSARGAF